MKTIWMPLVLWMLAFGALADQMPYGWLVSGGFRGAARVDYVSPPLESQRVNVVVAPATGAPKKILDDLFETNKAKALLASRGNEIIYERYGSGVGRRSTPLGYSISKSLTALAVGAAHCDGHIKSLDDPLQGYLPELAGTSWGAGQCPGCPQDVQRGVSNQPSTEWLEGPPHG